MAISRKELKSDEFVSGLDSAYEFFLEHRDRIIAAVVAVVVVAGIVWGVFAWRGSRNRHALAMLAAAINTLHAPVTKAAHPGLEAYPTGDARAQAAAKEFKAVVQRYGSTRAGQLAKYYLGVAQFVTNRPQGMATLTEAAKSKDEIASTAAKHALADLYVLEGKPEQAHKLLVELTQRNAPTFPRAAALMELADLDRTYNPKEAVEYYKQLEAEFPNSTTSDEAAQLLATIPGQKPAPADTDIAAPGVPEP